MMEIKLEQITSINSLKVGDKVLIREDLKLGEYESGSISLLVLEEMLEHKGKVGVVKRVNRNFQAVLLDIDNNNYWSEQMLAGKVLNIKEGDGYEMEVKAEGNKFHGLKKINCVEDLNIGDKVLIGEIEYGKKYPANNWDNNNNEVFHDMKKHIGEIAEILDIDEDGDIDIDLDDRENYWSYTMFEGKIEELEMDEMLEDDFIESFEDDIEDDVEDIPMQEVERIDAMAVYGLYVEKVIFNDPATIVFYRVPDTDLNTGEILDMSDVKKSVAKAIDGDVYNKDTGVKVALLKAYIKEANKKLKKI